MNEKTDPVKIGSLKLSGDELEILKTYRDYKRLREAAGWSSTLTNNRKSTLKGSLDTNPFIKNHGRVRKPDIGWPPQSNPTLRVYTRNN